MDWYSDMLLYDLVLGSLYNLVIRSTFITHGYRYRGQSFSLLGYNVHISHFKGLTMIQIQLLSIRDGGV